MAITGAQLITKIAIEGDAEAANKVRGYGKVVDETKERSDRASGGIAGMFKNALSFAAGGAIFAGIGFLKDQIGGVFTESMNAEHGMTETVTALQHMGNASGQTAQSISDFATKMSHLTEFSDDLVQHAENVMLTFGNIGKNIFPQATTAAMNMSAFLHTDLQSSIIQVGKALNDPVEGFNALRRVGVSFTDVEKENIKTMMAHKNLAGAQAIVLSELNKQFGGAAVAAGKTFGGQLAILQQNLDDVKQSIGDALMPILTQLLGHIMPLITAFGSWVASGHAVSDMIAAFNSHATILIPILVGIGAVLLGGLIAAVWSLAAGVIAATWPFLAIGAAIAGVTAIFMHFYQTNAGFKAFIDTIVTGFQNLWSLIQANFMPVMQRLGAFFQSTILPVLQQVGSFIVGTFRPAWDQLVTTWKQNLLPALQMLWGVFQQLWPVLKVVGIVLLASIVLPIAAVIAIVVVAGVAIMKWVALLIQGWGLLISFTGAAFSAIGTTITNFKNLVGSIFNAIGTFIHDKIMWIYNHNTYVHMFVDMIVSFFHNLQVAVQSVFFAIALLIGQKLAQAQAFAGNFRDALGSIFSQLGASIHDKITAAWNWIVGFMSGWPSQAFQWGINLIQGFINGIGSMFGAVGDAVSNIMGNVASILGFHSPAEKGPGKDADTWAPNLMKMYVGGLAAALPAMQAALNTLMVPVGNTLSGHAPAMAAPRVSSGAGAAPQIIVQPPDIYLDGVRLSRGLMPYIKDAIHYNVGGFGR